MRKIALFTYGGVEVQRVDDIVEGKLYIAVRDDEVFHPPRASIEQFAYLELYETSTEWFRSFAMNGFLPPISPSKRTSTVAPDVPAYAYEEEGSDFFDQLRRLPTTVEVDRQITEPPDRRRKSVRFQCIRVSV